MNRSIPLSLLGFSLLAGMAYLMVASPGQELDDRDSARDDGNPSTLQAEAQEASAAKPTQDGEATETERQRLETQGTPQTRIEIRGRLVDSQDKGLADTRITLHQGKPRGSGSPFVMSLGINKPKDPGVTVRTDTEGGFVARFAAGEAGWLRLDASLVWQGKAPRFGASTEDLDLGALCVLPAARIEGRVRDVDGNPIAGAQIYYHSTSTRSTHQAKSDSDGMFTLDRLRGGAGQLSLHEKNHVQQSRAFEVEPGKTHKGLILTMRRGERLRGRVLDDTGQPLVGARIQAMASGHTKISDDGVYEYSSSHTKTDDTGHFVLAGILKGRTQLRASAKGHSSKNRNITPERDFASEIEIRLDRLATILGHVLDNRGRPIPGSRVQALRKDPRNPGNRSRMAGDFMVYSSEVGYSSRGRGKPTAKDGSFLLENVRPGEVWLRATGPHREAVLGPLQLDPGQRLEGVEIRAEAGASIVALVRGPDDEPLVGARVSLHRLGNKTRTRPQILHFPGYRHQSLHNGALKSRHSDKEGRARFAGLEPGSYELRVSDKNFVSQGPSPVALGENAQVEERLKLVPGGFVAIQVLGGDDRPVAEQAVGIYQGKKMLLGGKTDAAGRAKLGPLPAGSYEAALRRSQSSQLIGVMHLPGPQAGGGQEIGSRQGFAIEAEQTTELRLLRPPTATLLGTLLDGNGPLAGAQLMLIPRRKGQRQLHPYYQSGQQTTASDAEGSFRFDGVEPGKYLLSVRPKAGTHPYRQELEIPAAGTQRIQVILRRGLAKLRATFDGKPVAGVVFRLNPSGPGAQFANSWFGQQKPGTQLQAKTDAQGEAEFADIPEGEYRLQIKGSDYRLESSLRITVRGGVAAELHTKLQKAASLRVLSNKPHVLLQLQRRGKDGKFGSTMHRWHAAGGIVKSLPVGSYRVRARNGQAQEQKWSEYQMLELRPGEQPELRFDFP